MSLLKITKVSDAGERCWGVVLLDSNHVPILRSEKGVSKGQVISVAKALKFEGPAAPVVVAQKDGQPEGLAWVIEKSDHGWITRFTSIESTTFDLMLKPEDAAGSPKIAEEAIERAKGCLAHAEIKWDPPEAEPAHEEKESDETDIEGLPGSGGQLSPKMREDLDRHLSWSMAQLPVLEGPVLLILDYSPRSGDPPLSIGFDYGRGPKCWMTATRLRKIGDAAPNPHEDYREFNWKGRRFMPYSIQRLPGLIFENIDVLMAVCRRLYRHVVWE